MELMELELSRGTRTKPGTFRTERFQFRHTSSTDITAEQRAPRRDIHQILRSSGELPLRLPHAD
ncbi:hypothetical protein J6590_003173 [Homalodisca vitripennis]|nr:hypothetical protein J6590_003173 [Homalodisca vitripennis]